MGTFLCYKKYTKTKPIKINEFELEKKWWNNRVENKYAWKISIDALKAKNYNLDTKNPYIEEVEEEYTLEELLNKFKENQNEIDNLFEIINKELNI